MESFGSGWRSGSRSPVGSGGMLATARPHSLLDLLAGCAAHSRWRLLHDDQPGLPVGDLLPDSPVWHCVLDRFVLERRGTDVDPQEEALHTYYSIDTKNCGTRGPSTWRLPPETAASPQFGAAHQQGPDWQ